MSLYYEDDAITLHHGDSLEVARTLPSGSADCIVTSPPYYGLRDYGSDGQYGLEESPAAYVETMRALFAELRRVLSDDGTLWLNIGDSYSGAVGPASDQKLNSRRDGTCDRKASAMGGDSLPRKSALPSKNLLGIPWRVAFALQDDGWILRNDIIWHKPNAMPESVTDRLSNRHEHVFMFTKAQRYWFDLDPIREPLAYPADPSKQSWNRPQAKESPLPGRDDIQHRADRTPYAPGVGPQSARAVTGKRHTAGRDPEAGGKNPGDVWSINTTPFPGAHFAVFPKELARRCIVAGCKPGGTVLDPFSGSGTTGLVAQQHGRKYVGIDLSESYLKLSLETRLQNGVLDFGVGA